MKNKASQTIEKIYEYTDRDFTNKKKEELKTTEGRVAWVLHNNPSARNNDKLLILDYWVYFDGLPKESAAIIFNATNTETIRRARAKLQNTYGLFPGSDKLKEDRESLRNVFKEWVRE
jgi:uncharacterized caspase-like protein